MNHREQLRTMVRGAYDIQKLRIQMSNRIVGNFKAKLGQEPGHSEEELEEDAKQLLAGLRRRYKKIMDGVKTFPKQASFEGDEVISTFTELCLLSQYLGLETMEAEHFKRLESVLTEFAVYTDFLRDVRGIGPAMAGVIISEIDITRAKYASSIWKYAGLDVAPDGQGRSKRKEHLVDCEYTDKDGKPATRLGITFNPFLKTKLMGVLASSFLRAGAGKYSDIYRDYKHRMECHTKYGPHNDKKKDENDKIITSKLRRHNMSLRYMVKMFLIDLYAAWREIEGLPVHPPYSEAKLGLKHGEDRPPVSKKTWPVTA